MNSLMKRYTGQDLEGSEHRSFCPCGVGVHHPSGMQMSSASQKILEPYTSGTFMEASSHRHDGSLTQSLALSPSWRVGCGAESATFLIWLGLSDDKPLTRGPPSIAKLEQKTLLSPRKFQGIYELHTRN